MIPDEAVEAAVEAFWVTGQEPNVDRLMAALEAAAPHLMAAKRESVTEWAAAHKETGNVYNYHRTREEAQAFVDGMAEVGAEMLVMTREVIPQSATEWTDAR